VGVSTYEIPCSSQRSKRSNCYAVCTCLDDDDDHHVGRVWLRLCAVATNRPIVHVPGDIWAWSAMMEWYRQGNFWIIHQSSLAILPPESYSSKTGSGEENKFWLTKHIVHTWNGSLTFRKILPHKTHGFTSPPKEGVQRILITLKSPSFSARFEPSNGGSSDKHANH
jgi:hypothetical protein